MFIYQSSSAGAWPQPKGGLFIKLSEWWIVSDQHFDRNGEIQPNILEFGYYSTGLYGEYGITKRLTGFLNFPFINYTYSIPPSMTGKQTITAPGDLDLGLKYAFLDRKGIAASISLLSGIPIGKVRESGNAGLQTGDGEWNQLLLLEAGTGYQISKATGWINIHGGYNFRSNGFTDEQLYGIEAGINFSKNKITITARIAGVTSIGESELYINPQSLFSNGKEYLSISPEVAYHISPTFGVIAGVGTAFSGKNIFANPTFTIGIFSRMKGDKTAQTQ